MDVTEPQAPTPYERIGGADITVRFPREWLSDWRAVSDGIERLIAGFKPQITGL